MKPFSLALCLFTLTAPLAAQGLDDPAGSQVAGELELSVAIDLYQGRKYPEARDRFKAIKERFAPQAGLPGNPSTLAAYYEMECLRKLGDLDGLTAAAVEFDKVPLVRKHHQRQVELYALWKLVNDKDWNQVEALAAKLPLAELAPDQRAQVAYCHALACEEQGRPTEALMAYHSAITADAGASEVIARRATLRILHIHLADPAVQSAMELWDTPLEERESIGRLNLIEAAALASLFEESLGAGSSLPPEFTVFTQYKSPE